MKGLIFATSNQHKIAEVSEILGGDFHITSLSELGFAQEIPETRDSLEGNAIQKVSFVYERLGLDCFAEDTGLEVDALSGDPGIRSARFAGPDKNAKKNMDLVLQLMTGIENRRARFCTVIALLLGGKLTTFEGMISGTLAELPTGDGGFGYDPIFIPAGFRQSFAELPESVKNEISHRAIAFKKMRIFLLKIRGKSRG